MKACLLAGLQRLQGSHNLPAHPRRNDDISVRMMHSLQNTNLLQHIVEWLPTTFANDPIKAHMGLPVELDGLCTRDHIQCFATIQGSSLVRQTCLHWPSARQ